MRLWLAIGTAVLALSGCGGGSLNKFPLKDPLWRDPDQRPFAKEPEEYFSPFAWDGANQLVFRPISRFFAVDPAGESVNVNALDEVPDSSWFVNRIGRHGMTPAQVEKGVCKTPLPDPGGPWIITKAKPNGFNPGFFVKGSDDKRYVMKFDHHPEGPRPTAADIIGTRFFHAAGYHVPCNRIVYVDPKTFQIDPDADSENASGEKIKLDQAGVDDVLKRSIRLTDGRFRASISLFIDGKPLGPWTYEGTRDDDPNDVVNHEDRRELRGMYVLASWLGYADSREQNTMGSFMEAPGGGYVRHYMLDVGNIFGSIWEPPMLGRRIGHSYYFDIPYILEDFVTLGAIERPWDRLRFGPTGSVFGYYEVDNYTPDEFRPGYPNPAFVRMRDDDAFWAASILLEMTDEAVRAVVATGELGHAESERYLADTLIERRDKTVRYHLARVNPLSRFEAGGATLRFENLGRRAGLGAAESYDVSWSRFDNATGAHEPLGAASSAAGPEVAIPADDAPFLAVTLRTRSAANPAWMQPVRVFLRLRDGRREVAGIEREP